MENKPTPDDLHNFGNNDNEIKDINFYRKEYLTERNVNGFPYKCPELFDEYFNLLLANFYKKQREILTVHFEEKTQFNKFIGLEIEKSNGTINHLKEWIKTHSNWQWPTKQISINVLETYIDFLNKKTLPGVKAYAEKPKTKPKSKQVKKPDAIFTDWVNLNTLELKKEFAQDFKTQIQGLTSSNLSIAINLLEIDRILIIPKTDRPSFLVSLEKYLGWNIGTRQGFSNKNDNKAKKTPIEETIKPLITKYKWKIGKI